MCRLKYDKQKKATYRPTCLSTLKPHIDNQIIIDSRKCSISLSSRANRKTLRTLEEMLCSRASYLSCNTIIIFSCTCRALRVLHPNDRFLGAYSRYVKCVTFNKHLNTQCGPFCARDTSADNQRAHSQ